MLSGKKLRQEKGFTQKLFQYLNIPPQTHQVRNMKLKANPFENA